MGLEYEAYPIVCDACCLIGHVASKCKVRVPSVTAGIAMPRGRTPTRSRKHRRRAALSRQRPHNQATSPCPAALVAVGSLSSPLPQQVPLNAPTMPPAVVATDPLSASTSPVGGDDPLSLVATGVCSAPVHPIQHVQTVHVVPHVSTMPGLSQATSSDISVPPGFVVKHLQMEDLGSCSSTPLVEDSVAFRSTFMVRDLEDLSSTIPVSPREVDEFSPVISKQTKKKSKIAAKALAKPALRAPNSARALLLKSAKHKKSK